MSLLGACAFFTQVPPWGSIPTGEGTAARAAVLSRNAPNGTSLTRSGTGFFVAHSGLVLTSAHVIADCPAVSIWRDGKRSETRLLALDQGADLGLLESSLPVPVFGLRVRDHPRLGETLFGVGFGVAHDLAPMTVFIRSTLSARATLPGGASAFEIHTRVPHGASGGLVVDRNGALAGMIAGYNTDTPNVGIIIAPQVITAFLAKHGVRLDKGSPGWRVVPAIERMLVDASVLVQCVPEMR